MEVWWEEKEKGRLDFRKTTMQQEEEGKGVKKRVIRVIQNNETPLREVTEWYVIIYEIKGEINLIISKGEKEEMNIVKKIF